MAGTSIGERAVAPLLDMPVLFFFHALRLFFTGNDQLVLVHADLDIFFVHAGKFGRYFKGIGCFRHTYRRAPAPMSAAEEF